MRPMSGRPNALSICSGTIWWLEAEVTIRTSYSGWRSASLPPRQPDTGWRRPPVGYLSEEADPGNVVAFANLTRMVTERCALDVIEDGAARRRPDIIHTAASD